MPRRSLLSASSKCSSSASHANCVPIFARITGTCWRTSMGTAWSLKWSRNLHTTESPKRVQRQHPPSTARETGRTYPAISPIDEPPRCGYVCPPARFLRPCQPASDERIPGSALPRDATRMPPSPNGSRNRQNLPVVESSPEGQRGRSEPDTKAPQYAPQGLDPGAKPRSAELRSCHRLDQGH